MSHPAGWYADPGRAGWWRWWDGTAWSAQTAPMGAPGAPGAATDPLPGPPEASARGLVARGLRRLAALAESPEGAETATAYRGSQPVPQQGGRVGSPWSGGRVAIVVTALILVAVLGGVVTAFAGGTENGYVAPEIRTGTAVAAAALAAVAIWGWRRYWLIADTPTVEVAGAHPGLCELAGTARPVGEPVTSWFTGAPVVWFHAIVERRTRSSNNKQSWRQVWHQSGGNRRFLLVGDEGAAIEVDASGAVLDGDRTIARHDPDRNTRFSEQALVSGDRVYVLGPVHLCDDGHLRVAKRHPDGRSGGRRGPLWVAQGGEAALRRRLRVTAVAATALSMALAAAVTAVEEVPSDDPRYDTELAVRDDGALLLPALTVAGLMALGYLVGYVWRLWNRLVALRSQAANAWSMIDVAAARRHATIGELVAVTRSAAAHERGAHVAAATKRGGLPDSAAVSRVDGELAADAPARSSVVARAEAAPDLQAGAAFTALFQELINSENRVAAARRFYNDAVTELADRTGTFPGLLLKPLLAPTIPPLLAFDATDLRPPVTNP